MLLNYECILIISYLLINSNKGDKRKVMDTFSYKGMWLYVDRVSGSGDEVPPVYTTV